MVALIVKVLHEDVQDYCSWKVMSCSFGLIVQTFRRNLLPYTLKMWDS